MKKLILAISALSLVSCTEAPAQVSDESVDQITDPGILARQANGLNTCKIEIDGKLLYEGVCNDDTDKEEPRFHTEFAGSTPEKSSKEVGHCPHIYECEPGEKFSEHFWEVVHDDETGKDTLFWNEGKYIDRAHNQVEGVVRYELPYIKMKHLSENEKAKVYRCFNGVTKLWEEKTDNSFEVSVKICYKG